VSTLVTDPSQLQHSRIVIDTDIFSYIFRKDSRASFFEPYLSHKTLSLTFISVSELYYGAYKNSWGASRIAQLEAAIKNYVVLPYDYLVCQKWAQLKIENERAGYALPYADSWIGACALQFDCALATNNGRHFQYINGLELVSPSLL
jgi:predicted nucleic acid-binding protein